MSAWLEGAGSACYALVVGLKNGAHAQEGEFIEVFLLPMHGLYDALLVGTTLQLQCRAWLASLHVFCL